MAQQVVLLLSDSGVQVLGQVFNLAAQGEKAVRGVLVASQAEGLWFQDEDLQETGHAVLVKWNFVDAVVREIAKRAEPEQRHIGFQAG